MPPTHGSRPLPEHWWSPVVHEPLQTPAMQVPLVQAVGVPHRPQPPHVCTSVPEHCVAPGVHTGAAPHEQVPHAHVDVHICMPYELHACVPPGVHGPCAEQVPLGFQAPLALHVWVSVPQLPHGTGLVCPGAHGPVHTPLTQVWFEHASGVPHCPLSHACTPLPEHCTCPAVHEPVHTPAEQVPLGQAAGSQCSGTSGRRSPSSVSAPPCRCSPRRRSRPSRCCSRSTPSWRRPTRCPPKHRPSR